MKKIFSLLIFILCTYSNVFASEMLPIDAVLVLDVSRSMRTADPDRVSRDAMNLFVDMLAENRDRVGVVAYAGEIEAVYPLTRLYSQQERAALQGFINALEYASWTDHGFGLLEAVEMLEDIQENENRQGIVIFFTDGNLNVSPHGTRTNEDAQADVYAAINRAAQMNVPIHTIGLNFDGNLHPQDFIAYATNGLAFETANAEDIPEIINAFFDELTAAVQILEVYEEPEAATYEAIAEEYEPPQYEPPASETADWRSNRAIAGVAAVLVLTAFLLVRNNRRKRVFTGSLMLETPDGRSRKIDLIGYGRRVSLGSLLRVGENTHPAFDAVIFTPSPTAPSHLPQLQITCKNPLVKFTKNFIPQEIKRGISIPPGTEVAISAGEMQIRVKYISA